MSATRIYIAFLSRDGGNPGVPLEWYDSIILQGHHIIRKYSGFLGHRSYPKRETNVGFLNYKVIEEILENTDKQKKKKQSQ